MNDGYYLAHFSIHGLVRSEEIEMGVNPDTGGQIGYVIELCKELSKRHKIHRIDLITRLIQDEKMSQDYSKSLEKIGCKSWIVRLPFGPEEYLPKETLWPHLDGLVEKCLKYFLTLGRKPDLIHCHYADAGYVGSKLSKILGVPFIFTGHSLGRPKFRRLLQLGLTEKEAEDKYNINRRIEAEELSLSAASLVVTSTRQEVEVQYAEYREHCPRMIVIPPGVDIARYASNNIIKDALSRVIKTLDRFLRNIHKPIVLAVARPDEKKNLHTLVSAFAQDNYLRNCANLVILAGQREKLIELESGPQKIWTTLINLIDDEDLYGSVAIPKTHSQDEIPAYMAVARLTHGVFVNPALTEPFGLTLLEAGAAGLPVVATNDGGPVDIIKKCGHGSLVDPLNVQGIAEAIKEIIKNKTNWTVLSKAAQDGVHRNYSWESHVSSYLEAISPLLETSKCLEDGE